VEFRFVIKAVGRRCYCLQDRRSAEYFLKLAGYCIKYTTFVFLYVIAFTAFYSAITIFRRVSPDQYNVRQVKYPPVAVALPHYLINIL